jgi:hypothetical protein
VSVTRFDRIRADECECCQRNRGDDERFHLLPPLVS